MRRNSFLYEKFFPLDVDKTKSGNEIPDALKEYIQIREYFKSLPKDKAIESLLFVNVDSGFDWILYGTHPVFRITEGAYLSYHACLFLLSLFLLVEFGAGDMQKIERTI